ncbi:ATP-binding protein [Chitinophaga sedimenti]|uniref:sensor histidine kinase n=1 Tax=Chitinophaga sedimenti TaxID=2033606 RepID=UPI0020043EB0|nr:PAS domain-containing sensor histidine kinase [Chitinophaga sedimenti]MCK7555857.1 ATP-binding protein [Chitinophaga sedimenti]
MHSEEQFRSLTQSLPQLIWTTRMDGYCDFFNKKWYDYTGATPESSFGDGWAQYIHEDQRNGLYASWRNSLETGAPVANEFQLKGKDGAYRWFNVLGNPIRDEERKILRWVGALTNIDEHRESKERLEKVVQDRTRELMRSNEDLQQFAHVASHDLKEPLRKIKFYVDRLQHDADTHLSTQGQASLGKIVASAERMSSMIEGVLSYSSTSAIQAPMGIVDLNNVLHDITTELEIIMQQKGATVSYHELPVVEGAEVLLYQLFYNLVFNSLKFARKGTPPVIQVDSSIEVINGQQMAKTVVRDNGIGFAEQYAGSIFHTFTRLNSKDRYEGTGLGLSLCKKIVERHHGQIEASGEENVGATFTIWLPLKQQA